jgi:hypothetical protein
MERVAGENIAGGKATFQGIVGREGVSKRIDIFATVITVGMLVNDVAELDLGYSPP